jgi:hypothetical protein
MWCEKNRNLLHRSLNFLCKPKIKDGSDNLDVQNGCMLLKHIHKFLDPEENQWVHLVRVAYQACPLLITVFVPFGGETALT